MATAIFDSFGSSRLSGAFVESRTGARGLEGNVWISGYTAPDAGAPRIYELNNTNLGIRLRAVPSPVRYPEGLGGDANVIWASDLLANRIYDLDPKDFSVRRSRSAPGPSGTSAGGIGGDQYVIWFARRGRSADLYHAYALNAADLSVRFHASRLWRGSGLTSIGGDRDVVWAIIGSSGDERIAELSVEDLGIIRHAAPPGGRIPFRIGGSASAIYLVSSDRTNNFLNILRPSDFRVLAVYKIPVGRIRPFGIGGA